MIIQTKSTPPTPQKQPYHRHWVSVLIAGLLVCSVLVVEIFLRPVRFSGWANSLTNDAGPPVLDHPFSWDDVKPSLVLTWQDCYESRQCARLIVPRNYSDPQAQLQSLHLPYRGPVLVNPGGPGGSGVDFVVRSGEAMSKILGPQFDIVGFDPRGVARSTPNVSFFDTPADRALWGGSMSVIAKGPGVDGLSSEWARAQLLGQLASEHDSNVLAHINTDNTARDMLQIVQAHQREKLQYWGFSYGSILGATFAAMFPDKVERLVIDGVADAENYYSTLWNNNLLDTDKTLQAFFDGCALAGPDLCPFYAPTPDQISQNLTALYAAISARPVPVRTETGYGLGLADLALGNGTALFELLATPRFKCSCDGSDPPAYVAVEAQMAILCGDGQAIPQDFESTEKYYEQFSNTSQWADVWAGIHIGCSKVPSSGWPNSPKTHFQGPFLANTSFPLLLVGNTAAKKMSRGFSGSVVLTQDSPGHCSISGPSTCTQKYVRDYFVDGKLPPDGEVCPVVRTPFPKQEARDVEDQTSFNSEAISLEDRELLDAIEQIHSSLSFATQHPMNRLGGFFL
ncbi:alpha/beta hydrolase fold-domain-containing protein [Infundibulicybe gibba]|nr:alpha/beta hydrolase fold-domain-containing protein [Infundibulicybe gibba]